MGNFVLSAPRENAIYRYEYRDTGGTWSPPQIMPGGAGDNRKTFTAPACDELRITAEYSEFLVFNKIHLSGLSIISGLGFQYDIGAGFGLVQPQPAENPPRPKYDITYTSDGNLSSNSAGVLITGIGQALLTLDQVTFGQYDFVPVNTFSDETWPVSPTRYARQRVGQGNRQRIEDKTRIFELNFWNISETEYYQLDYVVNTLSASGYVLIDIDEDSTQNRDSFLAYVSMANFVSRGAPKQTTLRVMELNAR